MTPTKQNETIGGTMKNLPYTEADDRWGMIIASGVCLLLVLLIALALTGSLSWL